MTALTIITVGYPGGRGGINSIRLNQMHNIIDIFLTSSCVTVFDCMTLERQQVVQRYNLRATGTRSRRHSFNHSSRESKWLVRALDSIAQAGRARCATLGNVT
jgi:hypothetical protein